MRRVQGALRLGAIVALLVALESPVRAQDADPASDADAVLDTGDAEAVTSAGVVHETERRGSAPDPARVPPADELPEHADAGPPLIHRRRPLTPEEELRDRARRTDVSEPLLPAIFQVHVGLGGALDTSLDAALRAHGFASTPLVVLADVGFLGRVTEWLAIGGRVGGRGRAWGSNHQSPALAGGLDVMAIAHARAYLGRVVDLGVALGLGVGWGGISIQGEPATSFAPRLHGSAELGFRVTPGARVMVRFGWDWFSLYDLDRYGSDLGLGGPSGSVGFEVRR